MFGLDMMKVGEPQPQKASSRQQDFQSDLGNEDVVMQYCRIVKLTRQGLVEAPCLGTPEISAILGGTISTILDDISAIPLSSMHHGWRHNEVAYSLQ